MLECKVGDKTIIINDSERQECEVWSRVSGYYRPVRDWNIGKQSEHKERKLYRENTENI